MGLGADLVHSTLSRHILADGYDFVIDLDKSAGCHFHDSRSGRDILDMFSCFASLPLGWNHPDLLAAKGELARASVNKVANSDRYTEPMAESVACILYTSPRPRDATPYRMSSYA